MKNNLILGILVFDRIKEAGRTQKVLSTHAGIIKTRLGFHELSDSVCSRVGTILLVLEGDQAGLEALTDDLSKIGGIEVKEFTFEFYTKKFT
ncbi:MAG TPA: hypothetical protein VLH61_00425 [Bacteroidales bacterium]|nr:hypothetical protein [Bacteroidales bacterium]